MKKEFENIIEKLENELKLADEEKLRCARENPMQFDSAKGYANGVANSIEIVKQEAEQYNVMIDGEYCFQSCGCTEMCGKCSRIANGDIDYYESICAFSEQTNADRIRSFSDEELADFIEQVSTDSMETISFGTKEYEEIWEHKETALKWLQSEVEEQNEQRRIS